LEGCDLIMDISKKGEISFPDYKDIKYR